VQWWPEFSSAPGESPPRRCDGQKRRSSGDRYALGVERTGRRWSPPTAAAETDGDAAQVAVQESLPRDLLKFDFFFPGRAEFTEEMRAELVGIDATAVDVFDTFSAADARRWLTTVRPYTAHLALRPFVEHLPRCGRSACRVGRR
jgi:hypothetical protein